MPVEMNPAAVDDLRAALSGAVILPDDEGFEDARAVWNGMIDIRPALIVRPSTPADIAPVLDFASRWGLPLAVRGGGHNVAGHGTVADGVVLDLDGWSGSPR